MKLFKEKYQREDKIHSFPRQDVAPAKKLSCEWMLAQCEAMYNAWLSGATKISAAHVDKIRENRLYIRGKQNSDVYRTAFLGDAVKSEVDFIRKGLMNIDWTPPGIVPKYLSIIKNMFGDINYEIVINALDETSTKEKAAKKWQLWVASQLKDAFQQVNEAAQMDIFQIPEVLPRTMEDLQFLESVGSFMLAREMAFEAAVQETKDRNKLNELLKKVVEDLFAWGVAVVRDYTCPVTQKVKYEYCDIGKTIVSFNNKDTYDPEYAGVIKTYSLAQIMERTGMKEDEARDIAQIYHSAGATNFTSSIDFEALDNNEDMAYRQKMWSNYNVHVLESEFESIDWEKKEIVKNKYGNESVYDRTNSEKKKFKGKVEKIPVRVRYKCAWIIGTDYVFDYGYQYDVPRKTPDQAGSSFHVYDVGEPFINIIKPNIDQATMAWYRIQNTIANATESGVIVDYDAFNNVVMGNKNVKPSELLKLGKMTGTWVTKKRGFDGQLNVNAQSPVQFFEGGAGRQLEENINIYRFNIQAIEEQLGMPPVVTAGKQERETTLGEQQLLFASSTNAIKHFMFATRELVAHLAENTVLRIQLIAKHSEDGYKAIVKSIGHEMAQVLKISKGDAVSEMGVEILPVFSAQTKETIFQAALASMQAGKSGTAPGIRMSDFMKIKRFLEAGLIRRAEQWLVYAEEREQKRAEEIQRQNMEMNQQGQLAHEQAKQQGRQGEIAAKGEQDRALSAQEAGQDIAANVLEGIMAGGGE